MGDHRAPEPDIRDAAAVPVRGEQFGPYRLEGLIGRGGMGEVHRAYDLHRNRVVALKRMPLHLGVDAEFRARFESEARIAARMRNPHVIPIHDYGQIDGRLFIDMRLVDGVDLKARLEVEGALPPEQAVAIIGQVASALDAAHAEGLVHRDVKPSNVLTADDDFVYLIDFGLARETAGSRVTRTGVAVGTLAYMAPERFAGPGDHLSDVYALACMLHEALTGQVPFPVDDFLAIMNAHANRPAPQPSRIRPGVPKALDVVIAKGMQKDPARRYRRAGDLAAAARAALIEDPPTDVTGWVARAVPVPVPVPARPARPRIWPAVLIGASVAAALLIALVAVVIVLDDGLDDEGFSSPGSATTETPDPSSAPGEPGTSDLVGSASVVAVIDIGASPRNLAITADGRWLYATNRDDDSVSVVDTTDGSVIDTLPLGAGNGPEGIAVTPDGGTLFVANHTASTVDVVDTATGSVRTTIPVGLSPTDVAVAADGTRAYVTTNDGGTVDVLDTDSVLTSVPTGGRPQSLAVAGDQVLVTDSGDGYLLLMDPADGSVDAGTPVGNVPDGVAVLPGGRTAYVVDIDDESVAVVDLQTLATTATIPVGSRPISVAVHPDGRTAYVTENDADSVSVIDTASGEVVDTLAVGGLPEAVAVAPDGRRAYVVNSADGTISVIDTGRSG